MINNLDNHVFNDEFDYKTLENLLDTLDHIKPKYVSREEYTSLKWNILQETWKDKFWVFYDLCIPKDLKQWEILFFINLLNKKFDLEKYSEINDILQKTKIIVWIICRDEKRHNSYPELYLDRLVLEYNLDPEFVERIKNNEIKINKENKDFIKSIKKERKYWLRWNNTKLWDNGEDVGNWTEQLWDLLLKELDLTFLRKWLDMIRFGMEIMTQADQKAIKKKKWTILTQTETKELDKKVMLLKDKIQIYKLKKELEKARLSWNKEEIEKLELEATNTILAWIREFPYQNTNNNYWYQPNKLPLHKEVQCVWFSLLWHAFLTELGINHNWLSVPWHSCLEVIIWWKNYYFDWTFANKVIEFEYWKEKGAYKEILLKWIKLFNSKWYAKSWKTEEVLLSHICNNKWNSFLGDKTYKESIKMFNKAIKINKDYYLAIRNKWFSVYNLFKKWTYGELSESYKEALDLINKSFSLYPDKNDYSNEQTKLNILTMYGTSTDNIIKNTESPNVKNIFLPYFYKILG